MMVGIRAIGTEKLAWMASDGAMMTITTTHRAEEMQCMARFCDGADRIPSGLRLFTKRLSELGKRTACGFFSDFSSCAGFPRLRFLL